mgnify:CR=1 FL=1
MTTLVQQYFSNSARRFPDKAGLNCADDSSTFRDSDLLTNAIANHICANGMERGSFIPFFMSKSINSIHSILSILKSDCAYVPIDVASPPGRINSILEVSNASLVIVDKASKELFLSHLPDGSKIDILVIDEFSGGDTSERDYQNLSIDIAYVLFTSGSTGVPKGVMIPHKAIIDYIDWCVSEYELSSSDVIANHAPLYFDNSTFDLYTAFSTGAELHLVHDAVNAVLPSLIKWIRNRKISTFFCVPSVMSMLLRSRRLKSDSFPDLRHMIAAGEVLPPDVVRGWMELYPHVQFTNMYGPTEITVDCSFHVIREIPTPDQQTIPIGKARPNMELFVRTENGELQQAVGARGELLVRGTSVAYGYLGDSEKTNKAFIQNPNNDVFADMLYCTGDLVEIDAQGDYLFLGRADEQIKYLGYRIELGEIEAALTSIDGVDEGVVVFNDSDKPEETGIGALVSSETLDEKALLAELRDKVPPYMVPSRVLLKTDDFPRTANEKYDRKSIKRLVFR